MESENDTIEPDDQSWDLRLGPCCGCGVEGPQVRNAIMLPYRCAVPGHGWGCLVCHLPADGVSTVCCDACLDREVLTVCRGYPGEDGRESIAAARQRGKHEHHMELHARYDASSIRGPT